MQLVTPPTYFKYPELNKGDILIENGIYVKSKEGKFGIQHYFEESTGEKKVLNSAGQLNFLVEDNLWAGRKCSIVYDGKIKLTKGNMAGKEAHQFALSVGESTMSEPKNEEAVSTDTTDASSLE